MFKKLRQILHASILVRIFVKRNNIVRFSLEIKIDRKNFCEKDHRATEQSLNDRKKIANERQINDCDLRI